MSEQTTNPQLLLTMARDNILAAEDSSTEERARTLIMVAQAQATVAQALEVRALRELLEERLPDKWDKYGYDL